MQSATKKPSLGTILGFAAGAVAAVALSGCGSAPQTPSPTLSAVATETTAEPIVDESTASPTPSDTLAAAETTVAPSPSPTRTAASPRAVRAPAPAVKAPAVKVPAPARTKAPAPARKTTAAAAVYYANCAAARAAGVAPLHVGDLGYRSGLDRDGDGTACE
jgi:hypothetical protein